MIKTLIRLEDGLKVHGNLQFLEFDILADKVNILHDSIIEEAITIVDWEDGKGCQWKTSIVVEKVSETEFKTINSHYIIEDMDHDLLTKIQNASYNPKGRRFFGPLTKPKMRKVKTEAEIEKGYLRAKKVFEDIEKVKK